MQSSAERLTGLVLENGWRVIEPITKSRNSTGGNFSVSYIVESSDGKKAFLKALDFSTAFASDNPTFALQVLTESYNFEKNVLLKCKNEKLGHVVTAVADGTVRIKEAFDGGVVPYLIFELANGDIRRQADIGKKLDTAWSLRALHQITVGIHELHSHGIAHQDLKPSNVLVFDRNISKVADFGRAAYKGHTPPHEELEVAGDPSYAPIEQLYGYVDTDWNRRRFGCDLYLLGSMTMFFFLGTGATTLYQKELARHFHWRYWGGTFEEVLPYLHDAFQKVLLRFENNLPDSLKNELPEIVSQLCDPNPLMRGHPRNRTTLNKYSLVRYISKFNLLAKRAELGILRP